jgi:hypothetical protein
MEEKIREGLSKFDRGLNTIVVFSEGCSSFERLNFPLKIMKQHIIVSVMIRRRGNLH